MRKCRLIGSLVAGAMVFGATYNPCGVKNEESTGRKIIDLRRNISRKGKCANPYGFRFIWTSVGGEDCAKGHIR